MPKNKLQSIIFTILMAFVMVYGMICYNISLDMGGMKNEIFLLAFHEIIIMLPVAFILEFFVVEKLSTAMAFRIVTPNDRPFVITLAISCMIVLCNNATSPCLDIWEPLASISTSTTKSDASDFNSLLNRFASLLLQIGRAHV